MCILAGSIPQQGQSQQSAICKEAQHNHSRQHRSLRQDRRRLASADFRVDFKFALRTQMQANDRLAELPAEKIYEGNQHQPNHRQAERPRQHQWQDRANRQQVCRRKRENQIPRDLK